MLKNPTLDLLKYSAFPELAAALRARSEAILRRWQELVRHRLPDANKLTLEQLRDDLPQVLAEMARALEAQDSGSVVGLGKVSGTHGEARFHQDYDANELLIEYGLLRPVLIDEVMSHLGRHLTPEELAALNMGVDTIIRRGVTRFIFDLQKQMKVVTDAQTKYLSFLSHDLRGGLNGVLLMAEVLKRELADEPRFADSVEDLDAMRRSILETVGTMDRFLHAERFRQGKVQPHNTTVDVGQVLHDMSTQFEYQAKDKGIELKLDLGEKSRTFTDKDLLGLILQNLISNAIKYTPRGRVRVVVEHPQEEPAKVESPKVESSKGVKISVIDQGPGIAAEQLATMFEAFTRGETHGQGGVGLGLSIARQAADLIGAKLTAESTVGQGSVFQVELPGE
jgi:signal transduction histidine kinase